MTPVAALARCGRSLAAHGRRDERRQLRLGPPPIGAELWLVGLGRDLLSLGPLAGMRLLNDQSLHMEVKAGSHVIIESR